MRAASLTALALALGACSFAPRGVTPDPGDDVPPIDAPPDTDPCIGPDTDGDGTVDACDPCPMDNPNDPDGDGVCTSVDICPTGDDALDADGDAIPDACDDWPCGAKPAAPADTVTWSTTKENVTLSAVNVGGQGRLVVANPNQSLDMMASYSIVDCQCTNCIDQIEVGFVPGAKQACLYNGNPQRGSVGNCGNPTTGMQTSTLTAPATSGTVFAVRFNRGNDTSCQSNGMWWANVPPAASSTVAFVCVR